MKNSIFNLAIALFAITNASFANTTVAPIKYPQTNEEAVMQPESLSNEAQAKPIDEIIAEDNRIIDNDTATKNPEIDSKTMDYIIAEDNRIIESNVSNEVYPLNFKKINKKATAVKMRNQKPLLIGQL